MWGREARFLAVVCLLGVLVVAPARAQTASAPELAEMRAALSEQARQIELLQQELLKLGDEQRYEEPIAERRGLTGADLDARIEDFERHPSSKLFVSGYGAASYVERASDQSSFGMQFVPIIHYQVNERLRLSGELEFDLRDDHSEVELEYAQVDFLLNDYVTLTMGKFLLPFNAFSERGHPSWVNKLPSMPPIYGGHGGGGIVPVLSDTGFEVRGGFRLPWSISEQGSRLNYAFYVTNGPRLEPHDETGEKFEALAEFLEAEAAIPAADDLLDAMGVEEHEDEIEFGGNFRDNNHNKALGGRIGFLPIPSLEIGASLLGGRYDDGDDLRFTLQGVDAAWRRGAFGLRGELLSLGFDLDDGTTERQNGFYVEASYALRDLAYRMGLSSQGPIARTGFVVRYGEVEDGEDFRETALGLNYWISPSVPLKIAYVFRDEKDNEIRNNRFELQLAYGF